ncbi:hypothetical protein HPB48_006524 [Haemaphysalis longicornis]|uniref:Tick transposon n=1 Tax=Haemaphysalis longicornis TaxID=44386 RepID=A0A9J6H3I5_HAELO|nr:hypothetical protein HPB48_006524 [Haemaphysalis longicornis]
MAKLPPLLNAILELRHVLYANDVTMWATRGSDGHIQNGLQEAADVVLNYDSLGGLSCAAEKSGLLVLPPHMRPVTKPEISIYLIPCVTPVRVLGLHLQSNGRDTHTVHLLKTQITQTTHMIRRISNRRAGLKEADTLRIVQSLLISRLAYHVPFHNLLRSELQRLNTALRTGIKAALGLPPYTSTQRLLQLGVHNTIEEIIDAKRAGQLIRLSTTRTGRHVLARLGYPEPSSPLPPNPLALAPVVCARLQVAPLPKNMHAETNQGRRRARAETLACQYGHDPHVIYTDAASYPAKPSAKVAVASTVAGNARTTCSVRTDSIRVADETAIQLAVSHITTARPAEADDDDKWAIITDSQATFRAYSLESSPSNLRNSDPSKLPFIRIVWTPGHASLPGNEHAHALAEEMTHRGSEEVDRQIQGGSKASASIPHPMNLSTLHSHSPTTAHKEKHYLHPTTPYPAPMPRHGGSSRHTRLQTYTAQTPLLLQPITLATAPACQSPTPTLYYSVWECPRPPEGLTPI